MYFWDEKKTNTFLSKTVALCADLNVDMVAGPVLSGAVMATAIVAAAMAQGRKMQAVLLNKCGGKYVPAKHCAGIRRVFQNSNPVKRVMLVDDIVSTGESMIHAAKEVAACYGKERLVAVISGNGWYVEPATLFMDEHPETRVFGFEDCKILEYKNDCQSTEYKEEQDGPLDPQPQ